MTIATGKPMLASDILDLTFFPKGAILTFSSTAWSATSAEFKNIWKICNAANHQADSNVPDLTDRFLRGGTSSDFTTGGGADSQSVFLAETNLPSHKHEATGLSFGGLNTSGLSIVSSGGHTHTGSGTTDNENPVHTHTFSGTAASGSLSLHKSSEGITAKSGVFDSSSYSGESNSSHGSLSYGGSTTINFSMTPAGSISGGSHAHKVNVEIPESGSHSHVVSGSITGGSVTGSTATTGDGTAFSVNTVPAYYTVIYIMKVV
ncbi:MAG: hypothetical protein LBJ25_06415 [Candidatus Margulisbacteria bacterium]|jgi:hypothetical protein|nr:hypothetical protein [Candidatus Margulisiibacteriota bacterium]